MSGYPVTRALVVVALTSIACACGADPASREPSGGGTGGIGTGGAGESGASGGEGGRSVEDLPYAREVVSFGPGEGAGFGMDELPDVVLGPPDGRGELSGSLDVLSLGKGGSIVLGFGELGIADVEGPDFVVFENAFWPGGDPALVFAEPGEVSVSEDGEDWRTFPCDAEGDAMGHFEGCAGVTPALEYDTSSGSLDPETTGGDAFDLADVGVSHARFVRIVDVSLAGSEPTAGFDLDAVGIVHVE
jgi:hypothetical protein